MKNFRRQKIDMRVVMLTVILVLFVAFTFALFGFGAALAEVAVIVVVILYLLGIDMRRRMGLAAYFDKGTRVLSTIMRNSIIDVKIPTITLDESGNVLWSNDEAAKIFEYKELFGKPIEQLLENFKLDNITPSQLEDGITVNITGSNNVYKMLGNYTTHQGRENNFDKELLVLYFVDITQAKRMEDSFINSRPVVGILVLDNYDELMQSIKGSSVSRTDVIAHAENMIEKWAEQSKGIVKKYENGKYLYFFEYSHLEKYREQRFSILDEIRTLSIGKFSLTMSIGIGVDGDTFEQNLDFANQAIDMALGRGGDQAVIKPKNNFEFYGGRSKTVEKRTKVKSRVFAQELSVLLDSADNVIVMGHKYADFDAVGASVGVARMAMVKQKPVNIICNRNTCLAMDIVTKLEKLEQYQDVFIDSATALDVLRLNTLLVIVDCHSQNLFEAPEVYKNAGMVALIDHHRKMADSIENTNMRFHEPYASSTSELVSELVQYIDGDGTILKEEAEALLSGIVLDTKNFNFNTGFRTFESAAYLRRSGADTIEVKKMFQSDFEDYVTKIEFIQKAVFYKERIAISYLEGSGDQINKTIMAQAADDLLSIEDVEASFVLYKVGETIHISGRSLGLVNVQLILEKLGGGGHSTTAGAQLSGEIAMVREQLCDAIDEYLKNANFSLEE